MTDPAALIGTVMREGFACAPPSQWTAFVATDAGAPWRTAMPVRVPWTSFAAADLAEASAYGASLPYLPDAGRDAWRVAGAAGGDCEDISLAVAARLIGRGWPAGALRLTTCLRGGKGHAVLTVCAAAPIGDLVWCNVVGEALPWRQLSDPSLPMPYAWIARWNGFDRWVRLCEASATGIPDRARA